MAGTEAAEAESQLQITPDGETVYAVWNAELDGEADAFFTMGQAYELGFEPEGLPRGDGGDDDDPHTVDDPADEGFWSCSSLGAPAAFGLWLVAVAGAAARRREH